MKGWSKSLICSVAMLVSGAPAAAQIYIHNSGDAKAVQNARTGLEASKVAFVGAFDANASALDALMRDERLTALNASLARRDQQIASVLDDSGRGSARLLGFIEQRQTQVAGKDWEVEAPAAQAGNIAARLRQVEDLNESLREMIVARNSSMALFDEHGGESGVSCNDTGAPGKAPPADTPPKAIESYKAALRECEQIREIVERIRSAFDRPDFPLPAALAVALGDTRRIDELRAGELKAAALRNQQLLELVSAQKALTKAAADHLRALEKYLKCEQRRANEPGADERIRKAAVELNSFLNWLSKLDENSGAALEPANSSAGEPAEGADGTRPEKCVAPGIVADAPAPITNSTGLLARARESGHPDLPSWSTLKAILQALNGFQPTRSLAAGLQKEAQEFQQGLLGEVLAGLASETNDPAQQRATIASNVLKLIGHFEDLQPNRLPNVSAVLIDVAAARLKATSAAVEADRLDQLSLLAEMKLRALGRELIGLQAARQTLSSQGKSNLNRALRQYATSWTDYRAPALVIEIDMLNRDYVAWAKRERAAVDATFAMLEPALGELEEYGSGGIKPADIARLLNVLGLGALVAEGR